MVVVVVGVHGGLPYPLPGGPGSVGGNYGLLRRTFGFSIGRWDDGTGYDTYDESPGS